MPKELDFSKDLDSKSQKQTSDI